MMDRIASLCVFTLLLTACGGGGGSESPTDLPEPPPIVVDTQPPVIALSGSQEISHEQGTEFVDPGASATDETDGNVAVTVSGEVGQAAGTYTLTYNASDAAGNTVTVERTIVVQDTLPPVLSMIGEDTITLALNDAYVEQGATAEDLADGTISVTVTGTVNTQQTGQYEVTYTAQDSAGNSVSLTRQVEVIDQSSTDIWVLTEGEAGARFDLGLNAFDEAINFAECNNDGGEACPGIAWRTAQDNERGTVLEIEHMPQADLAGFFVKASEPLDLTEYQQGALLFDLRLESGNDDFTVKLDCIFPCTSGNQSIAITITQSWQTITVPLQALEDAGLDLSQVDTGIVIWASAHDGTVFQLDNVRFSPTYDTESSLGSEPENPEVEYTLTTYGKGSISDTINPASYKCVFDFGNWIYNAGIVAPGIAGCDTNTGTPQGEPTPLFPQVTGPAAEKPLASHRWWGSVSFIGEMSNGDPNGAGYITPDPIAARISNTGFRMLGIPAGLSVRGIDFGNLIPDPFAEVFDGIAIGNTEFSQLEASAYDHSDGSVTVEWQAEQMPVMRATFVHGSPYVFVEVLQGQAELRTLREDGGEKGIYFENEQSLGVWTSVAGNTNYFLVTGEGETAFTDTSGANIGISNASNAFTITLMPINDATPNQAMIDYFESFARNVVASVEVAYEVDSLTQAVSVTHTYLNSLNEPVETVAGLMPLHWKNTLGSAFDFPYQVRSARGVTRFEQLSTFTYTLPFVGVLPALPTFQDTLDLETLQNQVLSFIEQGEEAWNPYNDTYWSGKSYAKVAELIAIADAIGMQDEQAQLMSWLKSELEDWFSAEKNEQLDTNKYFVYDSTWHTLLGMEESFAAHQQLNDHHFHYGYFVRAAAEICRHEKSWCDEENYGGMVRLLIRDYAGSKDDPLFPYLRHFDPANGFSWASGNVNFVRGNNNESTSEAANAYGAMVLFGLITEDETLTDRGIYLHASTTNTYWEYWNNIDGYTGLNEIEDNFPEGYNQITTSIIWGDGAVFSTWFSAAFAHILGIQGLPSNPLTLHIGQFADYLEDYVAVGLSESGNGQPSGLEADQWRDIWWNIWALTDATASISDYDSVTDYTPEAGESKAHTYHWIHTFSKLGHLKSGTGQITANHPSAMVFENLGVTHYVAYNYSDAAIVVTFSDGIELNVPAESFTVISL